MKYNSKTLDELCDVKIGRTPPRNQSEWFNSGASDDWKWVSIKDMGNCGKFITTTSETITDKAKETFNYATVASGTILLSFKLTLGRVVICDGEFVTNEAIAQLPIKDPSTIDRDYLYYYLKNYNWSNIGSTSSIATAVNSKMVKGIKIDFPDLETQKKIVRILSALDQKIELNNQKNGTYFNICHSLLNSYLSAENLEEHDLNEFLNVFTGKRNANETSPDGKYIFFSCAPEPLKSDTYIFDGSAIIIAGNGAYTGRTRFYEGKMELYQRTYACVPKNNDIQPLTYGFYVYMKNKFEQEKMGGTHGSAIPYIVIGDITKYKILYDKKLFEKFSTQVKPFIKAIRENEDENISLASLRDTLLPRLVSGVIDLSKVTAE